MARLERYHHGDLRRMLLAAAREALDKEGHEALSLAKLTSALGVSPAAPYRHFANREAILMALVEAGLAELDAEAEAAAATAGNALDKLRAVCVAYLDYAEFKPGLFRLLLGSPEGQAYVVQITGGTVRSYEIFVETVRQTMPDMDAAIARDAAAVIWSQLHGYAVLKAGGLFKQDLDSGQSRDVVIETAVHLVPTIRTFHRAKHCKAASDSGA